MAKLPQFFSQAGKGGSRRLLIISGTAVAVIALVSILATSSHEVMPVSDPSKMGAINALPGGLHTNPQLNKLASQTDSEGAQHALATGASYTPPFSAGTSIAQTPEVGVAPVVAPLPSQPAPSVRAVAVREPPAFKAVGATPTAAVQTSPRFAADPVGSQQGFVRQAAVNPQETAVYQKAVERVMSGWGSHVPRTEVEDSGLDSDTQASKSDPVKRPDSFKQPALSQASSRIAQAKSVRVLVPAGRGIYAHTVVAVDSDTGGPIVLQADSGPIAGDRLIGMFSKAGGHENLLVVQVTKVVHQGTEIGVSGLVISPSTMQTAVASSVDEHYLARFALPAAAAFVQGLGSALATTSNTVGQLSPLGGTNYVTSLNLPQQIGVGAGAAAQQIGTTLAQQAPTGPTIHLDANANVGVIFLGDVKTTDD